LTVTVWLLAADSVTISVNVEVPAFPSACITLLTERLTGTLIV
jgi:hypothetical protein